MASIAAFPTIRSSSGGMHIGAELSLPGDQSRQSLLLEQSCEGRLIHAHADANIVRLPGRHQRLVDCE
jgi:hypothetical protein